MTRNDNTNNLNVIVEAKSQYTKQLVNAVKDTIVDKLLEDYEYVKNHSRDNETLYDFQTKLISYKKWNSDDIDKETKKITDKCEFLSNIITAVFISNVRILTSVKMNQKKKKMKITVPSNETFLHRLYVCIARSIYNNVSHFHTNRNKKNEILKYISEGIDDCILNMLPLKDILDCYIGSAFEDDETEEDIEDMTHDTEEDMTHKTEEDIIHNTEEDVTNEHDVTNSGVDFIEPLEEDIDETQDVHDDVNPEIDNSEFETKSVQINDNKASKKNSKKFFDDIND